MSKVTNVTGRIVPVVGDDIDTDRIIPARYLKEITFSRMGDYPFYDERFNADGSKKQHPFNEQKFQGSKILVGNVNFGCGSSREHAPQALMRWGIKAVIAESFAEIFAGNCVMLGIPAVTLPKDKVLFLQKVSAAHPEIEWEVNLETMYLRTKTPIALNSMPMLEPDIHEISKVKFVLPESRRSALIEGTWDSTGLLIANGNLVKATAAKLPYMNGFA